MDVRILLLVRIVSGLISTELALIEGFCDGGDETSGWITRDFFLMLKLLSPKRVFGFSSVT
jgi:hypothetical protein